MPCGSRQRLNPGGSRQVALASNRADHVVVSLVACRRRGCERCSSANASSSTRDVGTVSVSAIIDEALARAADVPPATADGFRVLLTTSGTTGAPKVARHTVERLLGRIRASKAECGATRLLTYHPAAGIQGHP